MGNGNAHILSSLRSTLWHTWAHSWGVSRRSGGHSITRTKRLFCEDYDLGNNYDDDDVDEMDEDDYYLVDYDDSSLMSHLCQS